MKISFFLRCAFLLALLLSANCTSPSVSASQHTLLTTGAVKAQGIDTAGHIALADDCLNCLVDGAKVGSTTLTVLQGGIGTTSLADHGVVLGAGAGPLHSIPDGSSFGQVLTFNAVGTDPSWQDRFTLTGGSFPLPTSVNITNPANTLQYMGLQFTLATAGIYWLHGHIRWAIQVPSGGFLYCQFYDNTNGAFLANTDLALTFTPAGVTGLVEGTTGFNMRLVLASGMQARLYCGKGTGSYTTAAILATDTQGSTMVGYQRE